MKEKEMYININNENNNLIIKPLKEFVNKMKEENKKNNSYYNGKDIPLIEKIKKINIFTNIVPIEIDILYNKIKNMKQENNALLNVQKKTGNNNLNNIMNDNDEIDISNLNIFKDDDDDNNISINLNYKNKNSNNISQNSPSLLDRNKNNINLDIFNNLKLCNNNNNNNSNLDNNDMQNIKNIKSVNTTRNNIMDRNSKNPANSINIDLKNILEDNKPIYKTNSNSLKKDKNMVDIKAKYESDVPKTELRNFNNNSQSDKINLKIKEVNDYILNYHTNKNKVIKSLIYNDEEINKNNLKEEIPYSNKGIKKSRISLFKEEIVNKNIIRNIDKNRILSISPDIQNDQIVLLKKNIPNNNNLSNNLKFMNKNINISQPITNRSKNNNNLNQKKDFLNNRNNKLDIFDEINPSNTTKNIKNSHTIDSSRLNNNLIPNLNDNSFFNKNKMNENNDLYQKSINGLAEEVMKPSFLKSDVTMAKLGGGINKTNNNNNDSFLFLAKKKIKNNHKKDDNSNYLEIKNNIRKNSSPFNNNNINKRNNKNNNSLHRNRSFLY